MNDKEIIKDLLKFYKNVSKCEKCNTLFGHDNKKETLCVKCDPKTILKIKQKLADDIL